MATAKRAWINADGRCWCQRSVEAAASDCHKVVTLALDGEPLVNEADVLLTAATIVVRQRKDAESAAPER